MIGNGARLTRDYSEDWKRPGWMSAQSVPRGSAGEPLQENNGAMSDLLHTLIPYFGCVIHRTPEALELTGADRGFMNAAAITPRTFQAPFTVRTVAETDSTNLRLYWHLGEIILNWECSVRELRVHDPRTREQHGLEGEGFI